MQIVTSSFKSIIDKFAPEYGPYEALYKHFHANAELSWQEHQTAAKVEEKLREISSDLEIHTGIGGFGLIAVLRNGAGKTILLRADMDGLPVQEKSGLEYASKKQMKDHNGVLQPTMHACGHDMHITALSAAVQTLVSSREHWAGTLVFLFQPAEEKGSGARDMVKEGLYTKFGIGIPDILLGQHVFTTPAGSVSTRPGPAMAGADHITVTVYGRGGHGSMPHLCVDPVVLASSIVMKLQTVVSRGIPPGEMAVVTVGKLNAGTAENIISDHAVLGLSIRSASEKWRQVVLESVKRIVRAECEAAGSPKEPKFEATVSLPVTDNDKKVTEKLNRQFSAHFGDQHDPDLEMVAGSEDFGNLALPIDRPYCFWFFGGYDPEKWKKHKDEGTLDQIPSNHSPFFAPVVQPTLRTGTEALVVAALTFLSEK